MRRVFERFALMLDQPPLAELLRFTVGGAVVHTWVSLIGERSSGCNIVPFFLSVLLAYRVLPVIVRRLVPFGGSANAAWRERRRLAKRFDSYQWRKLFWFGLGMLGYQLLTDSSGSALLTLTLLCLVSGTLGLVIWRRRSGALESVDHLPARARDRTVGGRGEGFGCGS